MTDKKLEDKKLEDKKLEDKKLEDKKLEDKKLEDEKLEDEKSIWFSTYGLITAERILGKYQIKLSQDELIAGIKSTFSFYHQLLKVPLKHVLNGIIFEQANDYNIYVQKIFIDYLLSAEYIKGDDVQGASTREDIENEREQLVVLGKEFHKKEMEHLNLIATSQFMLIKITAEFNRALEESITSVTASINQSDSTVAETTVREAIIYALTYCDLIDPQLQSNQYLFIEKINDILKSTWSEDLKKKIMGNMTKVLDIVLHFKINIQTFLEQTEELNVQANLFRSQFYDRTIRLTELISLLSEYEIDPIQDAVNREALYFDKNIGAF